MKAKVGMAKKSKITRGGGNVFADLGLDLPEEHLVKAHLVILIAKIIEAEIAGENLLLAARREQFHQCGCAAAGRIRFWS